MRKPIIAITMGDPGGVGPEVITKALREITASKEVCYLVIGTRQAFDFLRQECGLAISFHDILQENFQDLKSDQINFLDISTLAFKRFNAKNKKRKKKPSFVFEIGKVALMNAAMAYASLEVATELAVRGIVDAIVTAPLNKTTLRLIDSKFQGHTEYLAQASGTKKFAMMFVSEKLKVTLVTIHMALKKVAQSLTQEIIFEKIRLTDRFLRVYFNLPKPKIAVCALNPHGNETGTEDEAKILPAVKEARRKKMEVVGPLSADRVFYDAYAGRFDAVISMYHDQGLAPFKMIAFEDGVNVTLGLPFLRTSPDHGTAFDIAYQNQADASSMVAALKLAKRFLVPH